LDPSTLFLNKITAYVGATALRGDAMILNLLSRSQHAAGLHKLNHTVNVAAPDVWQPIFGNLIFTLLAQHV